MILEAIYTNFAHQCVIGLPNDYQMSASVV